METFVIADPHFDHPDIILHSGLPWCTPNPAYDPALPFDFKKNNPFMVTAEDLAGYGEMIVDNWNGIVGRRDRVIINGDFAFANHAMWASRLKGHKVLVIGNHDAMSQKVLDECHFHEVHAFGFQKSIATGRTYPDGRAVKEDVTFCHYAMRSWPNSCYGSAHVYAHDHGRMPELDNTLSFSVSTNVWGFIPTPWEAIQARIAAKRKLVQIVSGRYENGDSIPRGTYSNDPEKRIAATRRKNLLVLKSIGIEVADDPRVRAVVPPKPAVEPKGDGTVSAVIAVADVPNSNGNVYTRESLMRIADGNRFIWVEKGGKLVLRAGRAVVADKDQVSALISSRLDEVGRAGIVASCGAAEEVGEA